MHKFSVIIPCFHDDDKLAHLLAQLQQLPNKVWQVIVVDAAGTSQCAEICKQFGALQIKTEPCRGQQLRTGAAQAMGDVLWFLHADAQLSPDPLTAMALALARGAIGGYFRFNFSRPRAWPAPILEAAIAWRCRFGVPYGDQGIFITRETYHQIGGHASWPLFEEVSLVRGARHLGKFLPLDEPIYIDSRRWQRDGWWRRTWHNRKLSFYFMCGVSPHKLAARYHSKIDS